MKLIQRRYADTLVLSPTGRLDHDSCDEFGAELPPLVEEARDGRALVLDLGR